MWIVPKTLSAFVPATEGLSLDSEELGWMFARSVTSRSKHMCKHYWSKKLKKVAWLRHLSGRILRPSMHLAFEAKWTESLADTPVNRCATAGKGLAKRPRYLWLKIREHINTIGARWVFAENVYGHLSLGLPTVFSDLEEDGYRVEAGIFSAEEVGAPHQRKRVFILGYSEHDTDYMDPRSDEGVKKNCNRSQKGRKRPNNLREQVDERTCRIYQEQNCSGEQKTGPSGRSEENARPNQEQYEWEPAQDD